MFLYLVYIIDVSSNGESCLALQLPTRGKSLLELWVTTFLPD